MSNFKILDIYFNKIRYTIALFLLIVANLQLNVESKSQYVQPISMGMQIAIPYDIANIWNRPVSLSPFLSTFLGVSLLYILFFGVITSPFGYMFGVPSQKYVLGLEEDTSIFAAMLDASDKWKNYTKDMNIDEENIPRSMATPIVRKIIEYRWDTPEFGESMFRFIPDNLINDAACQQLILCQAHSVIRRVPGLSVQTMRIFTKILPNIKEHHKEAIKVGLVEKRKCEDVFQDCPSNTLSLLIRILLESLPDWFRKILILPQF